MNKLEYQVRFLTPAFLGNAEQGGQWRTPPFKALLRHWWRVAAAKDHGYDHTKLRETEGKLFGHAWLKDETGKSWAKKSQVRLRLEPWAPGRLTNENWPGNGINKVVTTQDGKGKVRSDLYLGYGPVLAPSKKGKHPSIKLARNAIGTEKKEKATLRILSVAPPEQHQALADTLQLIHWFGTLGSRSRNGWGSLSFEGADIEAPNRMFTSPLLLRVVRPWQDCMETDWANAIGRDEKGPLIWLTSPLNNWQEAVQEFAEHLVAVRRIAKDFQRPGSLGGLQAIHLLGYPSGGKWKLNSWGNKARLASPLRFKVVKWEGTKLRGMIFHVPCDVPKPLQHQHKLKDSDRSWLRGHQTSVWEKIHGSLDGKLTRVNQVQGTSR